MERPERILIIGLLFCVAGVLAIWSIIEALFDSRLNLNFAVFLLPVGLGLLKGKPSSLGWANFWVILGYIGCGLMFVLMLINPGSAKAYWFDHVITGSRAVPFVAAGALSALIALVITHRLLRSPKSLAYFRKCGDQHEGQPT